MIPRSGSSPREGNGNPFQYSCLGNVMDKGALQVHGVAKSRVQLSDKTATIDRLVMNSFCIALNMSPCCRDHCSGLLQTLYVSWFQHPGKACCHSLSLLPTDQQSGKHTAPQSSLPILEVLWYFPTLTFHEMMRNQINSHSNIKKTVSISESPCCI